MNEKNKRGSVNVIHAICVLEEKKNTWTTGKPIQKFDYIGFNVIYVVCWCDGDACYCQHAAKQKKMKKRNISAFRKKWKNKHVKNVKWWTLEYRTMWCVMIYVQLYIVQYIIHIFVSLNWMVAMISYHQLFIISCYMWWQTALWRT